MLCHLFLLSMRGLACDQLGINHYQAPTHKGWGLWKMHLFLATIGCRDNLPWKLVVRGMRPYRSTLINNKAFFAPLNQWLQMELVYTLDLRMSWQRNGKVKKMPNFCRKIEKLGYSATPKFTYPCSYTDNKNTPYCLHHQSQLPLIKVIRISHGDTSHCSDVRKFAGNKFPVRNASRRFTQTDT